VQYLFYVARRPVEVLTPSTPRSRVDWNVCLVSGIYRNPFRSCSNSDLLLILPVSFPFLTQFWGLEARVIAVPFLVYDLRIRDTPG